MKVIEQRLLKAIRDRHGDWVSRDDLRVELNMSATHVTCAAQLYPDLIEIRWYERPRMAMAFRWKGETA